MKQPPDQFTLSDRLWADLIKQTCRSAAQQEDFALVRKLHFSDVILIGPQGKILGYDPLEDRFFDSGKKDMERRTAHRPAISPLQMANCLLWSTILFLMIRLSAGMLLDRYGSGQLRSSLQHLPFYVPMGATL